MKLRNTISLIGVCFAALTFLPACSQPDLTAAHQAAQNVETIASTQTPPASASSQEQQIHSLVQSVAPVIPFGPESLAILAALAGAAGTVIQTFRKSSAVTGHQAAITELARALPPEAKTSLSARTQSIVHKALS